MSYTAKHQRTKKKEARTKNLRDNVGLQQKQEKEREKEKSHLYHIVGF